MPASSAIAVTRTAISRCSCATSRAGCSSTPELPPVRFATISLRAIDDDTNCVRTALERVAGALRGDGEVDWTETHHRVAQDRCDEPDTYEIVGAFGQARVVASASVGELMLEDGLSPDDEPPAAITPEYDHRLDVRYQVLQYRKRTRDMFLSLLPGGRGDLVA